VQLVEGKARDRRRARAWQHTTSRPASMPPAQSQTHTLRPQMRLPRGVAVGPDGQAKVAAVRASEGPGEW